MENRKLFRPTYIRDFTCIGSTCSNSCCSGWTVTIDDETHRKYKKLKDIYRKTILRNIKTNLAPGISLPPGITAVITMDKHGNCPLWNKDGLCEIQKRFGHDYLSITCQSYPRLFLGVGDTIEEYLTPSCPEAAKIIMSNQDYMTFEEDIYSDFHYAIAPTLLDLKEYIDAEDRLEIFWVIRKMCVSILQFRKYTLWLRFVIIGLFLELVSAELPSITLKDASNIAEVFAEQLEQGIYDELASQLPENDELKALFLQNSFAFITKRKNVILESAKEGIGINAPEMDAGILIKSYNKAYDTYYQSFFKDKEYLLENYFVSTILCRGFPFDNPKDAQLHSLMNNYVSMSMKYGIMRNLLVGMCGHFKESFGHEILYNVISAISRVFEHNNEFNTKMLGLIPEKGGGLVSALSMMIRD